MNLKGILHSVMYRDTVTVHRAEKVLADDGTDDYAEEFAVIYANIPCKLSQYNMELAANVSERAMELSLNLRLCCDPDYDIRPNDILKVNHQGQVFTLCAGQKFAYPTHQEISARRKKEAGDGD